MGMITFYSVAKTEIINDWYLSSNSTWTIADTHFSHADTLSISNTGCLSFIANQQIVSTICESEPNALLDNGLFSLDDSLIHLSKTNVWILIGICTTFLLCGVLSIILNYIFRKGQYIDITEAMDAMPSDGVSFDIDLQPGNGEEEACEEDSFEENERIDLSVSDPLILSPHAMTKQGLVVPDVLLRKDSPANSDSCSSETDEEMEAGLGSPRVAKIRSESVTRDVYQNQKYATTTTLDSSSDASTSELCEDNSDYINML